MKTRFNLLVLMAAIAASALAANNPPAATPTGEMVVTSAPAMQGEQRLIDVDFPGGSIDKLLTAVGKADGMSLSIINATDNPDFARVELPAFKLRNVNLITIIEVVGKLLEVRGYRLAIAGSSGPNSLVCVMQKRDAKEPSPTYRAEFVSYQMTPYLSDQTIDEIVVAIRTAWELSPDHDPNGLRIKYHPGTQLLLVSGPQDGIFIANSVITTLKRKAEPKPAAAEKMPPPKS